MIDLYNVIKLDMYLTCTGIYSTCQIDRYVLIGLTGKMAKLRQKRHFFPETTCQPPTCDYMSKSSFQMYSLKDHINPGRDVPGFM